MKTFIIGLIALAAVVLFLLKDKLKGTSPTQGPTDTQKPAAVKKVTATKVTSEPRPKTLVENSTTTKPAVDKANMLSQLLEKKKLQTNDKSVLSDTRVNPVSTPVRDTIVLNPPKPKTLSVQPIATKTDKLYSNTITLRQTAPSAVSPYKKVFPTELQKSVIRPSLSIV